MVPRKDMVPRTNGVATSGFAIPSTSINSGATSKIPPLVQLLLVTLISFSTSFVLYSVGHPFTNYELSEVSRKPDTLSDALLFPLLRVAELGLGWFAGFDDLDMGSFALQTRLPYYFLLFTFYAITPQTCALALSFDVLSAFLPFYLLRGRIPAHSPKAPVGSVANRNIIQNFSIGILTTVLSAAVYGVIMYISYNTWLLTYLVVNFDGVRTFDVAHEAGLPFLVLTFFPLGWTAKILLFTPATGATKSLGDIKRQPFNPEIAGLGEHIKWNLWGFNKGTKVMMKRTLVLAAGVFLSTWVKTFKSLEGTDMLGSIGWAALWATASLANGAILRWVGDV